MGDKNNVMQAVYNPEEKQRSQLDLKVLRRPGRREGNMASGFDERHPEMVSMNGRFQKLIPIQMRVQCIASTRCYSRC